MSAWIRAPEERLLGGDELGSLKVTDERPGLRRAPQVESHGRADQHDADQLQSVTDPPADLAVAHHQLRIRAPPPAT